MKKGLFSMFFIVFILLTSSLHAEWQCFDETIPSGWAVVGRVKVNWCGGGPNDLNYYDIADFNNLPSGSSEWVCLDSPLPDSYWVHTRDGNRSDCGGSEQYNALELTNVEDLFYSQTGGTVGVCAASPQPAGFIVTTANTISQNCKGTTEVNYYTLKSLREAPIGTEKLACYSTNSIPSGWAEYDTTQTNLCGGSGQHNARMIRNVSAEPCQDQKYYKDNDGDTWGGNTSAYYCPDDVPNGWEERTGDCDDTRGDINPGATEICDNIDNNCNDEIDEGFQQYINYKDGDGDGYGAGSGVSSCFETMEGYVDNNLDCNDNNKLINPDAQEICNGKDDDCNSLIDDDDPGVTNVYTWCYDPDGDKVCDDPNDTISQCASTPDYTNLKYVKVDDMVDNCPDFPNEIKMYKGTPYTDVVFGASLPHTNNGYWDDHGNLHNTYYWQPDHDLDGIGDACDLKTDPDAMGYSTSHPWRHFGKSVPLWEGELFSFFEMNSTIGIYMAGGYYGSDDVSSPITGIIPNNGGLHRVHYCGLDLTEYCFEVKPDKTGCTSKLNDWANRCETSTENGKTFGRSHATINSPLYGNGERWPHVAWANSSSKARSIRYSEVNEHKNAIPTASVFLTHPVAYWNWKADIYAQYNCSDPQSIGVYAICENTSGSIRENTPVYYDLSSNYVGNSDEYLLSSNSSVNPDYFKNYSTRSDNSDYDQVGKWAMATRLNINPMVVKHKRSRLLTPDELKNSYKSFINQIMWKDSAPNILFSPYSLISDELDFVKYQTVGFLNSGSVSYSITESSIPVLSHMRQIISGDIPGVTYSIAKHYDDDDVYSFYVNYAPSNDWHKMGTISNYSDYDLEWSSATVHNKTVYIASSIEDDLGSFIKNLYRIVRNGSDFVIEPVMIISIDGSQIRLISAIGKLYVISDKNGVFSTMAINPETAETTLIDSGINPAFVRPLNIIGTETGIYIAGKYDPANPDNTIIAKLSDNNGWQIIHSNVNANTDKLIMNVIDGKVVMTDILAETLVTTRIVLDTANDSVNIEEIETPDIYGIEEGFGSYCLNETDNIVKGGLEMSGECMPFTHPWYRSFATGSTIYSVAGKGDRLYVGTNNSIKVYDISDPEAFVLKSTFSTGSRRVYDLEVADDDVMYAATSGGIYKLDTANPDTLASLSFFATSYNYQYRIQLYNDKLYVGDDNGINIRDKETFARLAYVNIDSVLDFAIANGEIALYRSSFWSAGLHIRDVETLNLKAYEYAECYTGELTTDHGAFYLSCDGYEYRFEGRPDTYFNFYPLDGDMREMQENHVYNGWTYIPDGSNVKLSTLNDVLSYCGNGVVESGELCDGNSVACTTISSSFVSGTAYCNSTCNGYNESNCSTDGW